jgi:hypothetical protein
MRFLLIAVASILLAVPAAGQTCQTDTLASVVDDHAADAPYLLVTVSGRWLRIYGQDFIDPRAWRRRDALTICAVGDSASLRVRDLHRDEELLTANDRVAIGSGPFQIMNGPGFRALLAQVAARCPDSRVRFATPAALLDAADGFEAALDSASRQRLNAVARRTPDGDFPACVGRDGAACPAGRAMDAMMKAGLMKRFAASVCGQGAAPWG